VFPSRYGLGFKHNSGYTWSLNVHREILRQFYLYFTRRQVSDSVCMVYCTAVVNWKGCGRKRSYRSWGWSPGIWGKGLRRMTIVSDQSISNIFELRNWEFHLRCSIIQGVTVLLLFCCINLCPVINRYIATVLSVYVHVSNWQYYRAHSLSCRRNKNDVNESDNTTKKIIHSAMTYRTTCDR
jgi:hypothetical protein